MKDLRVIKTPRFIYTVHAPEGKRFNPYIAEQAGITGEYEILHNGRTLEFTTHEDHTRERVAEAISRIPHLFISMPE